MIGWRRDLLLTLGAWLPLILQGGGTPVARADPVPPPGSSLPVPFVAQSELLCGGAAVVMVERWLGRRGGSPEEFRGLVRRSEGGIRTTDLVAAASARGWRSEASHGTPETIARSLRDSIPVIALLQVARSRYHYVVVVGWDSTTVVYHDPAVGPFVAVKIARFVAQWSATDRWLLTLRPGTMAPPMSPISDGKLSVAADSLPCRPWLDSAARAAEAMRLDDADRFLARASAECPREPLLLRETAGLRFRQRRYDDAILLTQRFLAQLPGDSLAWQLLASSHYLAGNASAALSAWNRIGRPSVDLTVIDGSRRVRFAVIDAAIDIAPRTTLTATRLALANRRVAAIPAVSGSRVSYAAVAGGVVEIRAAIVEQPALPPWPVLLATTAVRAIGQHEVALSTTSLLGAGERWSGQYRWAHADARRVVRLEMPARLGLPGVVMVEGRWERDRFNDSTVVAGERENARHAATLGFGTWANGSVELLASTRLERWRSEGDFLALGAGVAVHAVHDRIGLQLQGEEASGLRGQAGYARVTARLGWHPAIGSDALEWGLRLGADWSSRATPRALWPLAGGNLSSPIPLRAHRFAVNDLLPTDRMAPSAVHGGASADRNVLTLGPVRLGAGLFLDGATLFTPDRGRVSFLDAGAGVRLGMTGMPRTLLRIDLARGLVADRRWAVTVGLQPAWPVRLRPMR